MNAVRGPCGAPHELAGGLADGVDNKNDQARASLKQLS